jgi:hypothetical protein
MNDQYFFAHGPVIFGLISTVVSQEELSLVPMEPKWLDGDTLLLEGTSETQHYDPVEKNLQLTISIGISPFNCQSEMVAILGISI